MKPNIKFHIAQSVDILTERRKEGRKKVKEGGREEGRSALKKM